jgi:O-antigen/teichoic acid export membrane protein
LGGGLDQCDVQRATTTEVLASIEGRLLKQPGDGAGEVVGTPLAEHETAVHPKTRGFRVRQGLVRIRRVRAFWQAGVFTVSNGLVSILGVASTAILARHMSTAAFGAYALAISFLALSSMVFDFGLSSSAARLAALGDGRTRREIVGAAAVLYLPLACGYCVAIVALSYGIDTWFHVHVGSSLRIVAPIAVAIPATQIVQRLAEGVDRLHVASVSTLFLQVLLIALLAVAVSIDGSLSLTTAIAIRCTAVLVSIVVAVVWLRPLFREARKRIAEIARHTRIYGFQVYVGRLLSVGTYNMDVLMLGALANSRSVGFYSLAGSVAAAAGLPVLGMSSALFASMARAPRIRRHWVLLASGVGAVSAFFAWVLAEPFIRFAFSPRYAPAAALVLPLALAQAVRGVTSLYNTFLSSHGRGRQLRNTSFVLTGSNLIFNFALIPPFGAAGAAWASLAALVVNLAAYVVFYRRSLREPG